jgi:hypothetical protein
MVLWFDGLMVALRNESVQLPSEILSLTTNNQAISLSSNQSIYFFL